MKYVRQRLTVGAAAPGDEKFGHATILHQMGLESSQLEIPGRKRLEIAHGRVISEIIA